MHGKKIIGIILHKVIFIDKVIYRHIRYSDFMICYLAWKFMYLF